jgi:hypothetical protein
VVPVFKITVMPIEGASIAISNPMVGQLSDYTFTFTPTGHVSIPSGKIEIEVKYIS